MFKVVVSLSLDADGNASIERYECQEHYFEVADQGACDSLTNPDFTCSTSLPACGGQDGTTCCTGYEVIEAEPTE